MKGSIRRRSKNSWELTIDLGRDANGKRLRKFMNVQGLKADAERKLRELLASLDRGIPINTENVKVSEYLQRWLSDYTLTNTRPRTAERYASDVRLHISPVIGHVRLADLRASDIQLMLAKMLENGSSTRSVKHAYTVLKEALTHALHWGLVYRNVSEAVTPPKVIKKEIQPPDVEQVRRIILLAKDTPYETALTFMARTGCRRGECLGLRWKDVDFDSGTASIVFSLQRVGRQGLLMQPPKSAKSRRAIALDTTTVDTLRNHRGKQMLRRIDLGDSWEENDLVFPGLLGRPLDPATLTRNFEKLLKKAGIAGVRLHDLRHFHATTLLKGGTHLKIVQERLGHASIAITADTYSHVAPSLQRVAADSFAEAMDAELS